MPPASGNRSGNRSPAREEVGVPIAQIESAANDPFGVTYPEAVDQKDALSAALFSHLSAEKKRAFTATAKGGAWDASKNSSVQLAELYYRKLWNDRYDSCIADLSAELALSGLEFSKRVNQRKKLVETLATCTGSLKEGDLWFCRSMSRHTAAFVQLHLNQQGLDPNRTIMGQALVRQLGKSGGTGAFQLLTLSQLRELTGSRLVADGAKAFAPTQDEWVMHRSLFTPQTRPKSKPEIIGPYEKGYPKDVKGKVDLSQELLQMLRTESVKIKAAYMAAQQQIWTSAPGSSLRLAELFAAQLTGASLGSSLVMFMGHQGPQLASVWNAQETCIEPLASGEATAAPGDFWFYEKPVIHTAVFIKVVREGGSIDHAKTIMGHGLVRDMSSAGGTGKFQLLTLCQLRECMRARIKAYNPRSEWIVHRLLFPRGA